MVNEQNEYIAAIMSAELLLFCKDNGLPFVSADELLNRDELTEEQFGFLIAYCRIWEGLIE
jgi:hypothetical protein